MKTNFNMINKLFTLLLMASVLILSGCGEDPEKEDTPELITKATLTFTPNGGGAAVVVTATDPDGEGVRNIAVDGPINLTKDKTYVLSIGLVNGLVAATSPEYNITEEVQEEGDEHMFFFSWTNNVFSSPTGNGNIDNRADAVNYTGGANSVDAKGQPLGLTTTWTTATGVGSTSPLSGSFRVLLKHQPELKTATSTSSTGETDLDLTFTINVQ